MSRELKNIDKLFHENLAGNTEQPPMHIWDGIEHALDEAEGKVIALKKEKRRRYAFLLLLFIATGTTGILLNTNQPGNNAITATAPANISIETPHPTNVVPQTSNANDDQNNSPAGVSQKNQTVTVGIKQPARKLEVALLSKKATVEKTATLTPLPTEDIPENTTAGPALPTESMVVNTTSLPIAPIAPMEPAVQHLPGTPPGILPYTASLPSKKMMPAVQVKKQSRFAVTLFFAPDITTRNLEQNMGIVSLDERKEELLRTEKNGVLDFTVGARVEYKLDKHFSLASGLSLSTNTIDIAQKTVFARFDKDGALKFRLNLSSGYTFFKPKSLSSPQFLGDSAQALSSSSTLHYVNIPLAVKYNYPSGRFNFSLQAGIVARFITKQSIEAVYAFNGNNEKSRSNQIQGLKTNYFNGMVGIGADYALNNKIAVTVFPSFNFATTSINRDAPVKAYPNTLSLAMGLRFQL